jgi:monoamine oxidase
VQSLTSGFNEITPHLEKATADFNSADQRWDTAIARQYSSISVAAWLRRIRAPAWLLERFRGFRGLFLADPEDLSLLALIDFLAEDPFSSMDALRVREGNDAIATTMARQLRSRPRLKTMLRRVQSRPSGVVASVETSGHRVNIKADYLVAAVPATTLREVIFEPKLPPQQRAAITQLRYGGATRVLIQCAPRFWRRIGRYDLFGSDQPFGAVWSGNDQQRGRAGILSMLAGGGAAAQLRHMIRIGGPDAVLKRLRWLGEPDTVYAWKMVSWDEDPWARGGYAYFHAGFDPELRLWLSRPHKRIVFAGEHTSIRWQGYMNGAVESGKRAAAEIEAMTTPSLAR